MWEIIAVVAGVGLLAIIGAVVAFIKWADKDCETDSCFEESDYDN